MGTEQGKEVRFTALGLTDVGRVREHNEDNFLAADLALGKRGGSGDVLSGAVGRKGLTLVVADGMGGAAAGEVASQMAVDMLHQEFSGADLGGTVQAEQDVIALLEASIHKANESIFRKGQESREHHGMGTTLTVAVVVGPSLYLSQVGDSRGYILRKGQLRQVTRDQSLIGQLIEEGTLTEEQAEKLGGKNIILQALGVEENLKIESKRYDILAGDVLLLCSDGLSGMVKDADIEKILLEEHDLPKAAKRLIDAANANGGKDNVTCLLGRFEGTGLREPLAPLTDAEKAGGSWHAPPPPKSRAGRNAAIATGAILAVMGFVLLRPKAKLIQVTTNVEDTQVVVRASSEDVKGFEERKGTVSPGKNLEFDGLPKGKFLVEGSAPGFRTDRREVDASRDARVYEAPLHLRREPARNLKIKPPPYKEGVLDGVRVRLVHLEAGPDRSPEQTIVPNAGPEVDLRDFSWGKWDMEVSRPGFGTRKDTIEAKSGEEKVVDLPRLEEVFGSLTVRDAAEGSEVTAWDGEERVGGPVAVGPAGPVVLKVRACPLLVRVTKPARDKFEDRLEVTEGGPNAVSLSRHMAKVTFFGPGDMQVTSVAAPPGQAEVSGLVRPGKDRTAELRVLPGTYRFEADMRGERKVPFTLTLEPGETASKKIE